jgi:ubiquinone/menaquinone biosynthesis C-methylase UbiE
VRAVYDVTASRYVEFVGTEISPATEGTIDRSLLLAFSELIQSGPTGGVADIGCGPGRVAAFLAKRGLEVVGVDVSEGMLVAARRAHPHIQFEQGALAALPIEAEVLVGAVCWYSVIYTPPDLLREAFDELMRVLRPGGWVLLAFQGGSGEPVRRTHAHVTRIALTHYLHNPQSVTDQLEDARFTVHASVVREPELEHETTPQCFIFARRPTSLA